MPDIILLPIIYVLMAWYCVSFFYMVNYSRRSGATDLPFLHTIIKSVTGNIGDFFRAFYAIHSQHHKPITSKLIIISNIFSAAGIFLIPLASIFLEIWFT